MVSVEGELYSNDNMYKLLWNQNVSSRLRLKHDLIDHREGKQRLNIEDGMINIGLNKKQTSNIYVNNLCQ